MKPANSRETWLFVEQTRQITNACLTLYLLESIETLLEIFVNESIGFERKRKGKVLSFSTIGKVFACLVVARRHVILVKHFNSFESWPRLFSFWFLIIHRLFAFSNSFVRHFWTWKILNKVFFSSEHFRYYQVRNGEHRTHMGTIFSDPLQIEPYAFLST